MIYICDASSRRRRPMEFSLEIISISEHLPEGFLPLWSPNESLAVYTATRQVPERNKASLASQVLLVFIYIQFLIGSNVSLFPFVDLS